MVGRPKSVRIGPFTYRIRWRKHVYDMNDGVEDRDVVLSARADHYALQIVICSTLHPIVQRKSLLHEIAHACNWITGHDDETNEERFVRALAFPLLDVLRDNPRLVKWLTS